MKRRQVLITVLALFAVLVSATATPALAKPNNDVHYGSMGMTTLYNHPFTFTMVEVMDIQRSPVGPYDCLIIGTPDGSVMIIITDSYEFGEYVDSIFLPPGTPEDVDAYFEVEDEELEVWRKGKTLFAELTVDVTVIPDTLTVEPLSIMFKGIGGAMSGEETEEIPDTGLAMWAKFKGFYAFVTIVAHMDTAPCELTTVGMLLTHARWAIIEIT